MIITFNSPESSYVEHTQVPSRIYQDAINLFVSLPIRRGPGVLMNVSVGEYHALKTRFFFCDKVYFSNTIIITVLM